MHDSGILGGPGQSCQHHCQWQLAVSRPPLGTQVTGGEVVVLTLQLVVLTFDIVSCPTSLLTRLENLALSKKGF